MLSHLFISGMTLTQIYSQYVEVSESYEQEKQERQQVRGGEGNM